ncbi:MAG: hypothetical protein KGI58_01580 [Patescibacteria group bacterium]|nr:hypothetical protein [Patescibacteria group bacterium]
MNKKELEALSNQQLLDNFQRSIELDAKDNGNGKSPFDKSQLKSEILRRLNIKPSDKIRR